MNTHLSPLLIHLNDPKCCGKRCEDEMIMRERKREKVGGGDENE